jgi:phage gpG-like protein
MAFAAFRLASSIIKVGSSVIGRAAKGGGFRKFFPRSKTPRIKVSDIVRFQVITETEELEAILNSMHGLNIKRGEGRRMVKSAYGTMTRRVKQLAVNKFILDGSGLGADHIDEKRLTSRSGQLRKSIFTDASKSPKEAFVGAKAPYATIHEFGLGRFPERAFLRPALEEAAAQFDQDLYNAIVRHTGIT